VPESLDVPKHPHPSPLPEYGSTALTAGRERGQDSTVTRWHFVALIAILLLAAALRVHRLSEKSFWFDEFESVAMAAGHGFDHLDLPTNVLISNPPDLTNLDTAPPYWKAWYGESRGHMPPLYPLLLRLWGETFELGETSARAFSVVASVAAVVLLFLAVREWSGTAAALWAALLMSVAGPQIQMGQEARHYTLLLLEALGAAAAMARIERRGPTLWRGTALSLCVLTMSLTHYFAIGALVALTLYTALRLRGPSLRMTALSFITAGCFWLAIGAPLAWRHVGNVDDAALTAFLADRSPGHAARTALRFATLPVRFFTEPMTDSTAAAAIGVVAFFLAALLPVRRRDLLLWGLWLPLAVLPALLLDASRQTKHLEFIRYTLLASPALYALVAGALLHSCGVLRHVPPALAVIGCCLALPAAYEAWQKANWRGLARAHAANVRPGDVTVFWAGDDYSTYPHRAFLHASYYGDAERHPIILLTAPPAEARISSTASSSRRATLLTSASTATAASRPTWSPANRLDPK